MREDYSDITIVMDRSGSMGSIKHNMEQAIDAALEEQKSVPGKCLVTLVKFDDKYEVGYTALPLHNVPRTVIEPRDSTAMNDSIIRAIRETGERLSRLPENERPARVYVIIVTDGYENASVEFSDAKGGRAQVMERIKHQREKYNWTFTFQGANQDAIATARSYGILDGSALNFVADAGGVQKMSATLGKSLRASRGLSQQSYNAATKTGSFYGEDASQNQQPVV